MTCSSICRLRFLAGLTFPTIQALTFLMSCPSTFLACGAMVVSCGSNVRAISCNQARQASVSPPSRVSPGFGSSAAPSLCSRHSSTPCDSTGWSPWSVLATSARRQQKRARSASPPRSARAKAGASSPRASSPATSSRATAAGSGGTGATGSADVRAPRVRESSATRSVTPFSSSLSSRTCSAWSAVARRSPSSRCSPSCWNICREAS
mmetsp:Transcript_12881/g.28445  ORF Transcript_12881/g.28445 Transcript_12881/m.28445 type:complete len:208 (+) Transcript_12881:102-725(+)